MIFDTKIFENFLTNLQSENFPNGNQSSSIVRQISLFQKPTLQLCKAIRVVITQLCSSDVYLKSKNRVRSLFKHSAFDSVSMTFQ